MSPEDFEHHFRERIRVMLNWKLIRSFDCSVDLVHFALPDQGDLLYTPWYARADGSACGYNSSSGKPQSVASVASNTTLRGHHGVLDTAHPETVAVVPAYRLNSKAVLLLDGNHRAVSSQVARSKTAIAAFVLNAPIDEQILPDLRHWT